MPHATPEVNFAIFVHIAQTVLMDIPGDSRGRDLRYEWHACIPVWIDMIEAARFFAVAVAGLALDLTVAWSAARLLDLPLWLASASGFALAAAANYAAHELWTFRAGARQLSTVRALWYGLALIATLIVRVTTVAVLAGMFGDGLMLLVLLAGAGVSFCVNYLASKYLVFRSDAETKEPTL